MIVFHYQHSHSNLPTRPATGIYSFEFLLHSNLAAAVSRLRTVAMCRILPPLHFSTNKSTGFTRAVPKRECHPAEPFHPSNPPIQPAQPPPPSEPTPHLRRWFIPPCALHKITAPFAPLQKPPGSSRSPSSQPPVAPRRPLPIPRRRHRRIRPRRHHHYQRQRHHHFHDRLRDWFCDQLAEQFHARHQHHQFQRRHYSHHRRQLVQSRNRKLSGHRHHNPIHWLAPEHHRQLHRGLHRRQWHLVRDPGLRRLEFHLKQRILPEPGSLHLHHQRIGYL